MKANYLIEFCVVFSFSAFSVHSAYTPEEETVRLGIQSQPGSGANEEREISDETLLINRKSDLGTRMPKVLLLYLLFGPFLVDPAALKPLQIQIEKQKQQSKFPQSSGSSNAAQCYTRKGQEGNCTTFKECFPVEYYGEDTEMKPDHTALVDEMFTTSKSPGCVSRLNSVGDVEKIICCPISKPSTPSSLTNSTEMTQTEIPVNSNNTNSTEANLAEELDTLNSTTISETENSFGVPETSTTPSSSNIGSETEKTKTPCDKTTTTDAVAETEEMTTITPTTSSTTSDSTTSASITTSTQTTTTSTTTTTTTTTETTSVLPNPLAANCGRVKVYSATKAYKITGGKASYKGEFPWMVAIFAKNGKHMCGGTLLNSQYVLTASHCLSTYNEYDVAHLTVTIGDHNIQTVREGPHETRKIAQIILHRGFEIRTYENDVALMKLDRPVEFSEYIQPICLPKANSSQNIDGYEVVVAGWGRDRSFGYPSPTLKKVNIPIWKQSECQRVYNTFAPGRLTPKNICAGDGKRNKDACIGDSGGPLMQNLGGVWHQIGIVSWGKGCGSFPGVYTRVDQFVQWIEKNIR